MFILVRERDNIIIGTATRMVDEKTQNEKGIKVYEIKNSEFKPSMLGSKLVGYEQG